MRDRARVPVDGHGTDSDNDRRRVALLGALLLVALLALAWQAQAANAWYGKVTIAKVNEGGPQADLFDFAPALVDTKGAPITAPFQLAGGGSKTYDVLCNVKASGPKCGTHELEVTEQPATGYELKGVVCTTAKGSEPKPGAPVDADTTVNGATVSIKAGAGEWVKCVYTNAPKPPTPPPPPPPPGPPAGQTPPLADAAPASVAPVATPQVAVAPTRSASGTARLLGPSGCLIRRAVVATVRGRAIAKVVFAVDGRRASTLTRPRNGAFRLVLDVRRTSPGSHRVTARVSFKRSAATRSRTLRTRFLRCRAARVTPSFTG